MSSRDLSNKHDHEADRVIAKYFTQWAAPGMGGRVTSDRPFHHWDAELWSRDDAAKLHCLVEIKNRTRYTSRIGWFTDPGVCVSYKQLQEMREAHDYGYLVIAFKDAMFALEIGSILEFDYVWEPHNSQKMTDDHGKKPRRTKRSDIDIPKKYFIQLPEEIWNERICETYLHTAPRNG